MANPRLGFDAEHRFHAHPRSELLWLRHSIHFVPASAKDGNALQPFSFPLPGDDDYDPSWSPLGDVIVWDEEDLFILKKGIPERLLPGARDTSVVTLLGDGTDVNTQPAISPDGLTVAFARNVAGTAKIFTLPIGGGSPTQLTTGSQISDAYPKWSPDGRSIIFDRQFLSLSGKPRYLYQVPSSGGTASLLFQPSTGEALLPAFASDGKAVLAGVGAHLAPVVDVLDPSLGSAAPAIANYASLTYALLAPRESVDGTRISLLALTPDISPAGPQLWATRQNMNLPPVISAVGGQSINHQTPVVDFTLGQDSTLSLTVSRSDPESDALTDSAYFLRRDLGMSFAPGTQTLTWPAGDSPVGTYTVRFAVSDPSGGADYALARIAVRDITPPAAVSSLSAVCDPAGANEWDLSWSAVADDSTFAATGPAAAYDVRTSGAPITDANWGSATPIAGPAPPGSPGSTESMMLLVTGTTYLRLKVIDDVGNLSRLSNELILHTVVCGGSGMLAGGGGGGGAGAASLQSGPPIAQDLSVGPAENSMLDAARPGSPAADLLWLPGLVPSGGGYVVRVRQVDGHLAHLDDARLLVADHASGVQAFALRGAVICGQKQAPLAATDGDGADVVPQIDGANGPFVADSGAVLNVRLAADSAAQSNLVAVEARGETDLAHGLILEVPDGRGSWREKAAIHPRAQFDPIVVDSVGSSTVRIRFLSTHQVRFVGRVVLGSGPADVAWASLTSALSSRSGDVRAAIERPDTAFASLAGPDTLALSYDVPPLGQDLVRDCFLAVDATLVQQSGAVAARLEPSRTLLPALFALRPSQPNPFSGATSIRFDLPVGEVVRIDVFDAQGRRVRSLANRFYPAGYQAVGWNGDDEEGHVARPGIYFCRMEAGNFRGKRQVVLLP